MAKNQLPGQTQTMHRLVAFADVTRKHFPDLPDSLPLYRFELARVNNGVDSVPDFETKDDASAIEEQEKLTKEHIKHRREFREDYDLTKYTEYAWKHFCVSFCNLERFLDRNVRNPESANDVDAFRAWKGVAEWLDSRMADLESNVTGKDESVENLVKTGRTIVRDTYDELCNQMVYYGGQGCVEPKTDH